MKRQCDCSIRQRCHDSYPKHSGRWERRKHLFIIWLNAEEQEIKRKIKNKN